MPALIVLNPTERDYASHRFVLSIGQCGPTHFLVWGHLDDALSEVADWCADHMPGLVILKGLGRHKRDPLLDELMADTCKERGLAWPIPDDVDYSDSDAMQPYWDAEQDAYADMTDACEDAYIGNDEWCITLEDPSREELKAFIAELEARSYDDEPVVVPADSIEPAKPQTHWVYGSGMVGCLFDYGPHCAETKEQAIDGVLAVFADLSEGALSRARADLHSDGIHYFPELVRLEAGADYCEVSEQPGACPEDDR